MSHFGGYFVRNFYSVKNFEDLREIVILNERVAETKQASLCVKLEFAKKLIFLSSQSQSQSQTLITTTHFQLQPIY